MNIKYTESKNTNSKKEIPITAEYDDDNIPEIDNKIVEPLPESSRPRKDGPGGE